MGTAILVRGEAYQMNNFTAIIIVVLLIILAGLAGFVLIVNRNNITGGTATAPSPAGGNQNVKLLLNLGKLTPQQIDLNSQWPVIFTINNFSDEKHDLVIKKLDAQGKEIGDPLRSFEIIPTQTASIRMKLELGQYVIYCTIKKGIYSHRKSGEEAKIIVH